MSIVQSLKHFFSVRDSTPPTSVPPYVHLVSYYPNDRVGVIKYAGIFVGASVAREVAKRYSNLYGCDAIVTRFTLNYPEHGEIAGMEVYRVGERQEKRVS